MKKFLPINFLLGILVIAAFMGAFILGTKNVYAQSPGSCGLLGERCCTGYAGNPNPCRPNVGLQCDASTNTCVPDGTNANPPTRQDVMNSSNPEVAALGKNPIPAPGRIPCSDAKYPYEFSSDRPYQASPCGDSFKADFCGNTLQIQETTPSKTVDGIITELTGNPLFTLPEKTYAFSLAGAQLPILGNTEQTANSVIPTDSIDNATKMNEYVSWYLNGVNNRAEYPALDATSATGSSNIVNYSGPTQKLLPLSIQDAQRIETINSVTSQVTYTPDVPDYSGVHPGPTQTVTTGSNHNQIVGCSKKTQGGFLGFIEDILGIGRDVAIPCYTGNKASAQGDVNRLLDWVDSDTKNGDLSDFNKAANFLEDLAIGSISAIIPGLPTEAIRTSIANHYNFKTPPLPWHNPKTDKPYPTEIEFAKAYNEWRGKTCAIIPIVNKLLCFDNIFVPNKFAELYPYIPLANNVDHSAKNQIIAVPIQPEAGTEIQLASTAYNIIREPVLYFAHTQEDADTSKLLNKTYVPKTGTTDNPVAETTESNVGTTPSETECRTVTVRSNPGDYLFPEVSPSEVRVHVSPIPVTRIPCHQATIDCSSYRNKIIEQQGGNPPPCYPRQVSICQGTVSIKIVMITRTPYAESIFNSTTAGADSTFRKIYPKVEAGAPVSCIADIPAATGVTYKATSGVDNGSFKVLGPDKTNTTDNPQLYFAHIGSVYDYFLKGIQTALRPLGYADPTPDSGSYCTPPTPSECKVDVPDSALPPLYSGIFKSRFLDLANRWSAKCPGADLNLAAKCYNYVVTQSVKAKVNPAFALSIWLNETGASNYCASGPTAQDFGIRDPKIYQNIVQQLKRFLTLPFTSLYTSCQKQFTWSDPMLAFFSEFKSGTCNPNDKDANDYYALIHDNAWQYVAPGCILSNGNFAITWPTDTSCPVNSNIK